MSTPQVNPKVFVGSSVKGLDIARAVRANLVHDAKVTLWNEGIFSIMSTNLEDLLVATRGFDFAIFVFRGDDRVAMNDNSLSTVRDNVLFELGLFIGTLGRQRCFFVAPEDRGDHRIASDLDGINPATYNSSDEDVQAAMGPACDQIRKVIDRLGPLGTPKEFILYSTAQRFHPTDLTGTEGVIHHDKKPATPKGRGSLSFPGEGLIRVSRGNTEGRFEIQLRRDGQGEPSIRRLQEPPLRRLHICCDAQAKGARHTLRFVLKDERKETWLDNKTADISPGDWQNVDLHFRIRADVDALLRIDDEQVSAAPSSLTIRNLVVSEQAS
jgi:hypothetical protein